MHLGATTKLTYEDYEKLPEREGIICELDEGELLLEPSPTLRHNLIRQRAAMGLTQFIRHHHLGAVVEEMDFRLGLDTVRNPDVAFITADHLKKIDPDLSPVEGAPALAVEVISPSNLAQDTVKKVRQYLAAGCHAVWLIYPSLRLVEIHDAAGVRSLTDQESLDEDKPFAGSQILTFTWSLLRNRSPKVRMELRANSGQALLFIRLEFQRFSSG